jgi:DNA-binding transcriptional LysR family regulator
MVSGCALPDLAGLLAAFHGRYPGVAITLTEDGSDRLVELLCHGQLDLAVIGTAGPAVTGLETRILAATGLGVAVLPASAAPPETLHTLQVTPRLRSRLELAWNPAAAGSPASRALTEHARSLTPSPAP